jgi:putative hydrolases of HD superfamily
MKPETIIDFFTEIHPFDRIPRAGYLLRGVADPESVAAHSYFLSLMVMLFADAYPDRYNKGKALSMALIHDLPETDTMDIPMIAGDGEFRKAKQKAEENILHQLMDSLGGGYDEIFREYNSAVSPEACLVKGLDKAQMMLKIYLYEREHRGNLEEFWHNPDNFRDYGIEEIKDLFTAIARSAGRTVPKK